MDGFLNRLGNFARWSGFISLIGATFFFIFAAYSANRMVYYENYDAPYPSRNPDYKEFCSQMKRLGERCPSTSKWLDFRVNKYEERWDVASGTSASFIVYWLFSLLTQYLSIGKVALSPFRRRSSDDDDTSRASEDEGVTFAVDSQTLEQLTKHSHRADGPHPDVLSGVLVLLALIILTGVVTYFLNFFVGII